MTKHINFLIIFLLGAFSYFVIEILYIGYTHPTMMLAGGLSLITLAYLASKKSIPFILRCFLGGAVITAIEFIIGLTFNILLDFKIWDYSNVPFNLLGQICLSFSLAWILLSAVGIKISEKIIKLLPLGTVAENTKPLHID